MTIGRLSFNGRVRLYACIEGANHGVNVGQVLGNSQQRPSARWAVFRRLFKDGFSLAEIGRMTNRDHTTVLHALRNSP